MADDQAQSQSAADIQSLQEIFGRLRESLLSSGQDFRNLSTEASLLIEGIKTKFKELSSEDKRAVIDVIDNINTLIKIRDDYANIGVDQERRFYSEKEKLLWENLQKIRKYHAEVTELTEEDLRKRQQAEDAYTKEKFRPVSLQLIEISLGQYQN
jgi:hypothetical protein